MNTREQVNEVIAYLEAHLCEKTEIDPLAKIVGCSPYHLQRIFSAVTGMSMTEYIRRRRMSLAAAELIQTDARIVDIALKYGYDSPESFNRAFHAIYHQSPSEMRKRKPRLTPFSRISVSLEIEKIGRGLSMKNCIEYPFAFSGFWGRNFNNCFSSAYQYLNRNDPKLSPISQEDFFFFFGTMSGQNVTRLPYDESAVDSEWMVNNTASQIDFLMGFAGYEGKAVTDSFKEAVEASLREGRPVIAKLKGEGRDGFNLIIGYDEEKFLCPGFSDDARQILMSEDIENLYVFGEKGEPKYTYLDGLKRVRAVLAHNLERDYWNGILEKFVHYWDEGLNQKDVSEVRRRFERTADLMRHTFNCHNLGESMGRIQHAISGSTNDVKRYRHACDLIADACFTIHLNAWIPVEINNLMVWDKDRRNFNTEWALGNAVAYALKAIGEYDRRLLEAFDELIEITG